MSKKDKISITHTEEFQEIEYELIHALENLDETNSRIEALLQAHVQTDIVDSEANTDTAPQTTP